MIVSGEDVARFISNGLGFGLCPPYVAIGTERDGEIVNGVIINHYEGADCHLTAYGTGWTRTFLREIGSYIFDNLGCERFTMITRDRKVAGYALRLGGQIEGELRNHFGNGVNGIIIGVLREDYAIT